MTTPSTGGSGPVETKVTVAGLAATITTFIMAWITMQTSFLDGVAAPVSALVLAAVSGVLTFGASYAAKHTHRTDADAMASTKGKHV
jgi:hypothetical protein